MWSSLARVSLSFYLSPGIALRLPAPLSIASQSVGHLQFSISPLSFSCWENYLPSRQFLARAEHRKVKYFSVFGKRTSGCSAARGSVERRGRVHLNVAHVKWNIFQQYVEYIQPSFDSCIFVFPTGFAFVATLIFHWSFSFGEFLHFSRFTEHFCRAEQLITIRSGATIQA